MYRILRENLQVTDRRRQARHPTKDRPELVAEAPRQVYTWDISKLAGPTKGVYFDDCVMVDIYFRYIVGVHVQAREPGLLAVENGPKILDLPTEAWINKPAAIDGTEPAADQAAA